MDNPAIFSYNVRVGHGAEMLRGKIYADVIPNCGEMLISSKEFDSYEECETSLSNLMAHLTRFETRSSNKNHVLVSKINPELDTSGKKHMDASSWDRYTLMRTYIADSEELKNATLRYHVMGQIRSDRDVSVFRAHILEEKPVELE